MCVNMYCFSSGKKERNKQTNKKKTAYILEGVESGGLGASEVGMSP